VITVIECGRFARDALASGRGEVYAVFRRSLYLRFPGERYACLGDASLGRGPLNARVSERRALGHLNAGERLAVSLAGSRTWRPRPLLARAGGTALGANLDSLTRALTRHPARGGLGGAIIGAGSPLIDHARPAMEAIDTWLVRPGAPIPPLARALIGLGPGLTPSGDDFLAGVMIGLRATDNRAAAAALWGWLKPQAAMLTGAISRAHLAAAAHGEAHEALHACVDTLFGAKAARGHPRWGFLLSGLDAVGHFSGRDGLAGVVAVARQRFR
jgi:hypothetical protein